MSKRTRCRAGHRNPTAEKNRRRERPTGRFWKIPVFVRDSQGRMLRRGKRYTFRNARMFINGVECVPCPVSEMDFSWKPGDS